MEYLHSDITSEVLSAFYDVYNELGYGFLEKVYQNALFNELTQRGIHCHVWACRIQTSRSTPHGFICLGSSNPCGVPSSI